MTMCRVSLIEPFWFRGRFSRSWEAKGLVRLNVAGRVGEGDADMVNYRFRWSRWGRSPGLVGRSRSPPVSRAA